MARFPLWLVPLTMAGLASPLAGQRLYRLEVSAAGAYHLFDSNTDLTPALGLSGRLGYWFAGPFSLEVEGIYARPHTDSPPEDPVNVTGVSGWLLGNVRLKQRVHLILKGGYGHISYGRCPDASTPGSGPCGSADVLQGGAGLRLGLSPTLFTRVDGVFQRSTTSLEFSNVILQGGLSLMLGSPTLRDHDGDKVDDRDDRCQDTLRGALVDKRGCPTDQDGDGVPDGLDRCPATVAGATADPAGCPQDSDRDGYLDGLDRCPDTPPDAVVGKAGCPIDADNDGVFDGLDRCAATPAAAQVDALGCPKDGDGDGVPDGLDRCATTVAGAQVDPLGCPKDSDGDGVPDGLDRCVTSARGAAVNSEGCPVVVPVREQVVVLPGSVWPFRSAALGRAALPILDSIAAMLIADPRARAEVNGFAHDRLVPADNTRLSQQRADSVRAYLLRQGVPVTRVTAVGRGLRSLSGSDTSDAARMANRRVEIRITRSP